MAASWWGVSLRSPGDTVNVSLRFGNTDFGDILDRRIAVVTVERNSLELNNNEVDGFNTSDHGFNSLSIALANGELHIGGGGRKSNDLLTAEGLDGFSPREIAVWSIGELSVPVFSVESCRPPEEALSSGLTIEELDAKFRVSRDPVEGYWRYFDRSNDPMFARIGGRYTLAVIKNDSESQPGTRQPVSYDIIYIDGAQTYRDRWKPMMLKGMLRTTIFDGHYDLEWVDSTFNRITEDIHAEIENGALLTVSFPLLKTIIRFSKIP